MKSISIYLLTLLFLQAITVTAIQAGHPGGDESHPVETYTAIGKYERVAGEFLQSPGLASPALQAQYAAAIQDAATAAPEEIVHNLSSINPWNNRLIRQMDHGTTRVLTVTWTGWTGYNPLVGTTTTVTRDVWITLAPEIKTFLARNPVAAADRPLRIEQLMGLPPDNGKTWFVEMWVDPDDLFRPSPDPEITDSEAGIDFPRSKRFVTISPDHIAWINALKASSYGPAGYPWTSLGYTYDWGNPQGKVGLSEYVIRAGAVVKIHAATATADYLTVPPAAADVWAQYL